MKCEKQATYLLISVTLTLLFCVTGCGKATLRNSVQGQGVDTAPEIVSGNVSRTVLQRIDALERTCAQDMGIPPRGIAPLAEKVRGSLLGGARSVSMEKNPSIAIITGFWIMKKVVDRADGTHQSFGNASETDGPVGTAHLATGLARAGIPVRVVTDEVNEGAVRAALAEAAQRLEITIPLEVVPWKLPDALNDTLADNTARATTSIASMAKRWKADGVTHVMSLERVGPAWSDGHPHTMGGLDISAYTAPLNLLYEAGDWTKLAIGDGGNEIGMGSLDRELIRKAITNGKGGSIASATSADFLQVCGVSNWGGPTFLFALALLRPDMSERLLAGLTPEKDKAILQAVVEKGPAVDGIRGTRELSVDNLNWEVHGELLKQLWRAYEGR
jgi:D-glutamate cyclase